MTYDPVLNFLSALGILGDIIATTFEAISLPLVTVVLYPLQSIISYITASSTAA